MQTENNVVWHTVWRVDKFTVEQVEHVRQLTGVENPDGDLLSTHVEPDSVEVIDGNMMTNQGLARIVTRFVFNTGQAADSTHVRLGVGNSSAAESPTHSDLQADTGTANRQWKVMDSGYPASPTTDTASFKSTFNAAEANCVWNEWGLDIQNATAVDSTAVDAVCLLNRKVQFLGTKAANTVWALRADVQFVG